MKRIGTIISTNHDWINYLPPAEKNFLSLFGVDEKIASLSKGEIESLLRTRYRTLNRTPEINLAYTVLKNQKLREDYLWMLNYYELHIIDEVIHKSSKAEIEEDEEDMMKKIIVQAMRRHRMERENPYSRGSYQIK